MNYIFNEHGICMNPDIEKVVESDDCNCELRLACDGSGVWYNAVDVMYGNEGFSYGVSCRYESYSCREEARISGLRMISRYLKRFGGVKYARAVDKMICGSVQLELFNQ